MGPEHLRYELVGFAAITPFVLVGGPLFRRYYPTVRVHSASGAGIGLSKLQITRVTLGWDAKAGTISLWDLPGRRSLSGEQAITAFRQLLPWLVRENLQQLLAEYAVTEKAYNLLRGVGGLRGLLHALDGFRADNVGRVIISDLPAIYLVALDLALGGRDTDNRLGSDLREKALEATTVARVAEELDGK